LFWDLSSVVGDCLAMEVRRFEDFVSRKRGTLGELGWSAGAGWFPYFR
jgi:hypothetical protein